MIFPLYSWDTNTKFSYEIVKNLDIDVAAFSPRYATV